MPNIYGDNRECMKSVESMMEAAMAMRAAPPVPGELEFFPRAFLFGHYDSRGGAMITFDQPHALAAIRSYIQNCFGDDPDRAPAVDSAMLDFLGRFEIVVVGAPLPQVQANGGHVHSAHLDVYAGEPSGDLLYEHGYECFKVFYRYKFPGTMEDFSDHETELEVKVFIKLFDPASWECTDEIQAGIREHFPNFVFTSYKDQPEGTNRRNKFEGLEWEVDSGEMGAQTRYRLEHDQIGEDACGCAVFHDYVNRNPKPEEGETTS